MTVPVARALRNARVVGIDLSPGKLDYARRHVAGLANVQLVEADCRRYLAQLASDTVDLVLFLEVDFFAGDERMLREIARVVPYRFRSGSACSRGSTATRWTQSHDPPRFRLKSEASSRRSSSRSATSTPP
jgi:SAM-dependent methyltransferase